MLSKSAFFCECAHIETLIGEGEVAEVLDSSKFSGNWTRSLSNAYVITEMGTEISSCLMESDTENKGICGASSSFEMQWLDK